MSTTITKAFTLIEALAGSHEPQSISDLVRRTTFAKSNIHFLLSALRENGYVEQDATRRYFLTLKLWEMGTRVLGRLELRRIASPYLASLADTTSETVNLAILDHHEVLYLHKIDSPMPVQAYTPEGQRAPAYCTSTGKAMLAYQPAEQIRKVARMIERHTDRTVSDAAELTNELRKIRNRGYSVNRGEWRSSVRGVAAPIMNSAGEVIAAVGVFGPAERLSARKLDQLATTVRMTGSSISRALGYDG